MTARPVHSHTAVQRAFIVRKLAAFEPIRAITAAFAAVFPDTACNENDVLATDPETTLVSPELHAMFLATREAVLLDPKSAVYADQQARLIALSNQAKFYASNNQFDAQRAVFRQIAEELGVVGGGSKVVGKAAPIASEMIDEIRVTIVDPKAPAPAVPT